MAMPRQALVALLLAVGTLPAAQALPVACVAQLDSYAAPHHVTRGMPWGITAALGDASPIPDVTGAEARLRVRFAFADGSPWFDVTADAPVPSVPRWTFVVPADAPLGAGHLEYFLSETDDTLATCTISPLSTYADAHVEIWD
jgi:hypothetical protein